ncbi:hypothetical protein I3843_04G167900 [Carya illinoinensis]|nr:hypothetical protein I3843_04G167900 [Carya illinoinensis]
MCILEISAFCELWWKKDRHLGIASLSTMVLLRYPSKCFLIPLNSVEYVQYFGLFFRCYGIGVDYCI